jgi:hypothetical protein
LTEKKNVSRKILIAVAVGVIVLFGVTGAIAAYWQAESNANIQPTPTPTPGTPNLVSANLRCYDNRTIPDAPFLQVTGTVTNNGNAVANNCTVHVTAARATGGAVINETAHFDSLEAGASTDICFTFPYTGDPLLTTNAVLDWTN